MHSNQGLNICNYSSELTKKQKNKLTTFIFHLMATPTPAPANRALWLNAWHDPVASIHTVSSCIRIADVTGDGDPKLLIADQNRTLRMYKGEFKVNLQLTVNFDM